MGRIAKPSPWRIIRDCTPTPTARRNKPTGGLDFTKSQHLVLGYDWSFHENWRLKTEIYYQSLYDAPIMIRPTPVFFNA